jgi:hypothetical protein
MLRAYKGGAKLNREKLFKLMRRKRIEYMRNFMKLDGGNSLKNNSSSELAKLRKDLGRLKKKVGQKKPETRKRGAFDKFCKWCKRAERSGIHTHESEDCGFKFPNKNKRTVKFTKR